MNTLSPYDVATLAYLAAAVAGAALGFFLWGNGGHHS